MDENLNGKKKKKKKNLNGLHFLITISRTHVNTVTDIKVFHACYYLCSKKDLLVVTFSPRV